jgi:hypothetical protein
MGWLTAALIFAVAYLLTLALLDGRVGKKSRSPELDHGGGLNAF